MEVNHIIKLKKTELNTLLKQITQDKKEYSTIYKLIYIYARQTKEVLSLTKKDINTKKNTITFKINNKPTTFPITKNIKKELTTITEKLKQNEYLFINTPEDINSQGSLLNYYLNQTIIKLNQTKGWECNKLSLTDLKKLRAQHLIKEGVRLETIMELFLNTNISEFKEFIKYEELIAKNPYTSVDTIFTEHTNINIFSIEGYNKEEIFTAVNNNGDECNIILDFNIIEIIGFNNVAVEVSKIDEGYLVDQLSLLNNGEYLIIDDLKFYKY